jgi:transcriptional regulator with XRE-family HTH domain
MHSTVGIKDPNIVPMDFKGKLNRACELRRLTNQRELAELARVSKSSLNRWLQGTSTPSVYEAARLAEVLKVPLDWLVKDDDQLEPPESQSLPEDEAAIIRFYRSKKAKGELTEDDAIDGMASMLRREVSPSGESKGLEFRATGSKRNNPKSSGA